MTFEEFDYVDVDYDSNTFTIIKEGHIYTYDINQEAALYSHILNARGVDNVDYANKYEVYSQEDEYYVEDTGQTVDADIKELWERLQEM